MNTEKLEFMFSEKTYSSKNGGIKRKPQKVMPAISFGVNMQLTDKEIELLLAQVKSMAAFLNQKGLNEQYQAFQEKNYSKAGNELTEWFIKWN